jgi:hypothetical protein
MNGRTKGGATYRYWTLAQRSWICIVALLPRNYDSCEDNLDADTHDEKLVCSVEDKQCPIMTTKAFGGDVSICGNCGLLWKGRHKSLSRHDYQHCQEDQPPMKKQRTQDEHIPTVDLTELDDGNTTDSKVLARAILDMHKKLKDVKVVIREKVVFNEDPEKEAEIAHLKMDLQSYKDKLEECSRQLKEKEDAYASLEKEFNDALECIELLEEEVDYLNRKA